MAPVQLWHSPPVAPSIVSEVEWVLKHEHSITGSIDVAVSEHFPDYRSRRLSHWRRLYFEQDWASIPFHVASKYSQVPNKYRKLVHAPLKGPGSAYQLPSGIEELVERHGFHVCLVYCIHLVEYNVVYIYIHTVLYICRYTLQMASPHIQEDESGWCNSPHGLLGRVSSTVIHWVLRHLLAP